jgi:predicted Fe-Mo cluster-binding NifX family protein
MNNFDQTISMRATVKIAIPMAEGGFSDHFGGAREFMIFEGDRKTCSLDRNELFAAPEHKPGSLPKWLGQQNVDAVIASAIGERALGMLAAMGIEVFLAEGDLEPAELARACLSGRLSSANRENTRCSGHHNHEDGHECHHH